MSVSITRPQAQANKRALRTRRRRQRRRILTTATIVLTTALAALQTQGSVQASPLVSAANTSTWDELVALESAKLQAPTTQPVALSAPAQTSARPFALSDGRAVAPADWKLVLFLQSNCRYCTQFDPELKAISTRTGFEVFPYSLDGQGDASFPAALPAPPEVILEFFGNGLPIATPTVFLVNVHTMAAYPLTQGATDAASFTARLDEVLRIALDTTESPSQGATHAR